MRFCLLLMFVSISMVLGCGGAPAGPKMYSVTGTLTVGGKPLEDINVQLIPVDLGTATILSAGKTDAAGRFAVVGTNGHKGAVPGKYKVVLARTNTPPPSSTTAASHDQSGAPPQQADLPFPAEYSSVTTSPKPVEITNQAVTLDLKL